MIRKPVFIDNGDGTITDTANELTWAKEDSWQVETKWFTWDEADRYAKDMAHSQFGGFVEWRLPTIAEAKTLYDPDMENHDKYGTKLFFNPIFPNGCLPTIWLHEASMSGDDYILDLRNGEIRTLYKSKSGRMAARPVRKAYELIE